MDGSTTLPQAEGVNRKDRLPVSDRPECVAFIGDSLSEDSIRGGLSQMSSLLHTRRGNVQSAIHVLEHEPTPRVLLVDVSGVSEPLRELERLASVCSPDVRVLVIGDRSDIGFYRTLTHDLGVVEYIAKPLTNDLVSRLFGPCFLDEDISASTDAHGQGKIIAVYGARGGCGATTIAVNLALQLAEVGRGHVSLLDLHLRGGTAGLILGVSSGTGLRTALEEPDRVDGLLLERVSIAINSRTPVDRGRGADGLHATAQRGRYAAGSGPVTTTIQLRDCRHVRTPWLSGAGGSSCMPAVHHRDRAGCCWHPRHVGNPPNDCFGRWRSRSGGVLTDSTNRAR